MDFSIEFWEDDALVAFYAYAYLIPYALDPYFVISSTYCWTRERLCRTSIDNEFRKIHIPVAFFGALRDRRARLVTSCT